MDARDELRAALAAQQQQGDARVREEAELAQARKEYEKDELAVMSQLHDAANLTLQALAPVATDRLPYTPRYETLTNRMLNPQKYIEGWKISFGSEEYVLCPDGTLIRPQLNPGGLQPHHWTLWNWVDLRIRNARDATVTSEGPSEWDKAFILLERRDREAARAAMRARLEGARKRVTELLAGILQDHEVSV